jgi:hypothetical protein
MLTHPCHLTILSVLAPKYPGPTYWVLQPQLAGVVRYEKTSRTTTLPSLSVLYLDAIRRLNHHLEIAASGGFTAQYGGARQDAAWQIPADGEYNALYSNHTHSTT